MPTHLERVQTCLEGFGCTVEPSGPGIMIQVQRAAGDFPMYFFIAPWTVTLVVIAEPPLQVPDARMAEAALLLNRMNFGLLNGCFEMNPEGGQLRYRGTLNFSDAQLTDSLIFNLYHNCDLAMRCFLSVLRAFVEAGHSPELALESYDADG